MPWNQTYIVLVEYNATAKEGLWQISAAQSLDGYITPTEEANLVNGTMSIAALQDAYSENQDVLDIITGAGGFPIWAFGDSTSTPSFYLLDSQADAAFAAQWETWRGVHTDAIVLHYSSEEFQDSQNVENPPGVGDPLPPNHAALLGSLGYAPYHP